MHNKEIEQQVKQQKLNYYISEIAKTKIHIAAFESIADEDNVKAQMEALEKLKTIYKAVESYEFD